MARKPTPRPTDREVDILKALWASGPSTVRDVHAALEAETGMGYTTVLKLMQIMTEKGILVRDASERPQRFQPAASRDATQRALIADLMNRAFGGSPGAFVLQALSGRHTTADERRRIREMLDDLDEAPDRGEDHDPDDSRDEEGAR